MENNMEVEITETNDIYDAAEALRLHDAGLPLDSAKVGTVDIVETVPLIVIHIGD
jgi:hypothetical protein